jgi:hypothetical protein
VPTPIATSQKAGLGEWVTNVTPLPACRPYNSGHVTRAGASVLTLLLRCYVRRVGARHAPARATSSEGRAERRSRPQVALSPRPFPRRPLRRPKRPGLVPLAGEGGPPLPAPVGAHYESAPCLQVEQGLVSEIVTFVSGHTV